MRSGILLFRDELDVDRAWNINYDPELARRTNVQTAGIACKRTDGFLAEL